MQWRNIYRGFIMGITDLIPGVSGGTIAFILGIYDQLLAAISGILSRDWKKHLGFLLPLGLGIGIAMLSLSKVIEYLLENHHQPTQFFFVGLIIGVLPFLSRQADIKKNFKAGHFILIVLLGLLLASTAFIKPADTTPITELNGANAIGLFLAGWAGSMAMLLPGISGSFILLLLGVYSTAIGALSNLNIPIIAVIGAGVIVGLLVSSKAISYLLTHYTHIMYAAIIGLILGSVVIIFPGIPSDTLSIAISIMTFLAGLVVAVLFSSPRKRKTSSTS
ncbi:putative membrane protein [Cytobacillus eiseniae]|uniref:Membrane protein n=1 Tax=Cytobacillus eiseniae TaxID=762947 RepID=A0ABS4RKA5_9BACI|nr:DUF368 domain-containing protein [Cytobacillus eiseniae]MBP2242729.1 putative membrane protein [Cytobacillus eiseniae]